MTPTMTTTAHVPQAAKGYVANLALDARLGADPDSVHPFYFWFRPEPVQMQLAANYATQRVLGLSHGYSLYEGGDNIRVTFQLQVHRTLIAADLAAQRGSTPQAATQLTATAAQRRALSDRIARGWAYLQALLVPPAVVGGLVGGAPPACLLVLPGLLALRARLLELTGQALAADEEGNCVQLTVDCTFEEAPLRRYTMQDVLARGLQRTWGLQ
jgi:hypothetical protein